MSDPHSNRILHALGLALALAATATGCTRGSGTPAQQEREVAGFSRVDVGGAFEVDIDVGPDFRVVVHADDNLVERVITDVDGDTLKIHLDGSATTRSPLRAEISMPALAGVDVSGATRADVEGVASASIDLDASGASHLAVRGKATHVEIDGSGAAKIDARSLEAGSVKINASGATKASVTATEAIEADASGSSEVRYFGNPTSVGKETSGASSIEPG